MVKLSFKEEAREQSWTKFIVILYTSNQRQLTLYVIMDRVL